MISKDDLQYLRAMAERLAPVYSANPKVKAIAIVGSVARGLVDRVSDIDTIIYYDSVPTEDEVLAARAQNGGENGAWYGKDPERGYAEYYFVDGVKCDFGHSTIADWKETMAQVLVEFDSTPAMQ